MGLYYPNQVTSVLVGTKEGSTRTGVALTSAYDVANKTKILETAGYSKLDLNILYTMGSGESSNSIEVRLEESPDGSNFYRVANESESAGATTLTAREYTFVGVNAAAATISIKTDLSSKFIRVSFKETGVSANAGTVYCEATRSGR